MHMYIDGHLDLAFNAVCVNHDLHQPLDTLRQKDDEALVSLPALAQGKVGIAFATIFTLGAHAYRPENDALTMPHYHNAEEAHQQGLEQLRLYQRWEAEGYVRILRTQRDVKEHQKAWLEDQRLGIVILIEGADPIRTPEEVKFWWDEGVRIVGPAWQSTRYAGGTHQPAGLSHDGKALIEAMQNIGMILDVSHLAEQSFWDCLEFYPAHNSHAIIASHSNARYITPTDRHLNNAMLQALAERDAVVGVVMANTFLRPDRDRSSPKHSVTLDDVGKQAEHLASFLGWKGVAIGTDFDGGFGRSRVPAEIDSIRDFELFGQAVPEEARDTFLGRNWLRVLEQHLPT